MQKITLLSLLAVVLFVGVESSGRDEAFNKYATMKIYEDCYGKDEVKKMYYEMKEACTKCHGQAEPDSTSSAFTFMMALFQRYQMRVHHQEEQKSMQRYQVEQLAYQLRPEYMDSLYDAPMYQSSGKMVAPTNRYESFYYQKRPVSYPTYHYDHLMGIRGKRAADEKMVKSSEQVKDKKQPMASDSSKPAAEPIKMFDMEEMKNMDLERVPEQIRHMFVKLHLQVSNVTCIMKELKFMNDDYEPDYESLKKRVDVMKISSDMKADLHKGIDYCHKTSSCVPEEGYGLFKDMTKPMAFFKCFEGKKMDVCMKKDLRERFGEFFDEELMALSRTFGLTDDKKTADPDTMFDMMYGFEMSEMKSFF